MANEANPANARNSSEQGTVGEVLGQAQQVLSQVTDQAREQVATQLEHRKHFVSDGLDSMSGALRQAASRLREDNQPGAPQLLDGVASGMDSVADYVRDRSIGDMMTDAEQFARRNPAAVIGGAFVAGMLATRFLKLSGRSATAARPRAGRGSAAGRQPSGAEPGRRTGTSGI